MDFVRVPENLVKKLKENGDTYVAYSKFGNMNIGDINKKLGLNIESPMEIRKNSNVTEKTILGEKLGYCCKEYVSEYMYGLERKYIKTELGIIKLPSKLLRDDLLTFKADDRYEPEYLYYNIYKILFKEDGTYTIIE